MFVRKMWGAPTVHYKNESGTQTVTQKTELPGWVTEAAQKNLNQAYNVSQAMPGPYGGPRYAGLTDGAKANIAGLQLQTGQTQPAFELAKSGAAAAMNYNPSQVQSGAYNPAQIGATPQMDAAQIGAVPQINAAQINDVPEMRSAYVGNLPSVSAWNVGPLPTMYSSLIRSVPQFNGQQIGTRGDVNALMVGGLDGVRADQVNSRNLADTDLKPYLNPYTTNVIDNAMKAFETQRLQSLNGIADQAIRSKAFGGSRQGILEGVTNAASALNAGNMAANLMSQNFAQAQQAAMGDVTRNLAAQQANQMANLQAGTTNLQSSLQGQMANQAAALNAQQGNQRIGLQTDLANQATDLASNQANQQALMDANRLNQASDMQAQQTNIQGTLQAMLANQASGLTSEQANQNAFLRGALANQSADLTTSGANQSARMQAALANQNADMAANNTNMNALMQAALANQAANMSAGNTNLGALMQSALANQQAGNRAAEFNVGNNLQAQLANQQAGLQGAGFNLTAANALGQLTGQGQAAYLDALRSALTGQTLVQQDKQGQYDAARQAYTENQQFPLQQLQIPLQALGMTPYPTSTTSTGPAQSSGSGLLQGIGAASSAVGALGSLVTAFSDRTEKTDIKKVGTDDETGLNLYAYRYKGDPKSYPKVVGPMAQDIAKKYPDQVHEVGGKMAVNLGFGPMRRAFN